MAGLDMIPIVPPDLGAVLSSPVAYSEWALTIPAPAPAPRVRRPGRLRSRVAALAAVVAAAGLAITGCSAGAHAAQRPVWDGRHPAVWLSATDPMCYARIAGRHSVIRAGNRGPVFRAECQRDGYGFAWGVIPGGAK